MCEWLPSELHTHTLHSDGAMTLLQLAQSAKALGLRCIALTDHNTISGHAEIESVQRQTGITIIPGLEWTTFYGHMTVLGVTEYVDWKDIGPDEIDKGIDRIHCSGGLAGIAHPFRPGSPICTGCYWDFDVRDWEKPDMIEVWSETFPSINPVNQRAFDLWQKRLAGGARLTAVAGRDWHRNDTSGPVAVTYLQISVRSSIPLLQRTLAAIKNGKVVVSMGPLFTFEIETTNGKVGVGEIIAGAAKSVRAIFHINRTVRGGFWKSNDEGLEAVLVSDSGIVGSMSVAGDNCAMNVTTADVAFLRAELYGKLNGIRCMVAFTNPIYIQSRNE
jgi:Predicted metal-dependent phosphoesterases (PHP family)